MCVPCQLLPEEHVGSGAEAALPGLLLPGLVVAMPGPGVGALRDQETHNIPAPGSSNAGARSPPPPANKIAWGTVEIKRYIAQESSMSLEQ